MSSGGTGGTAPTNCNLSDRNKHWSVSYALKNGDASCFDPTTSMSVVLPGTQDVKLVYPSRIDLAYPLYDPRPLCDIDYTTIPYPNCYGILHDEMSTDNCELLVSYKRTACQNVTDVVPVNINVTIDSIATIDGKSITGTIQGETSCGATYDFVATLQ